MTSFTTRLLTAAAFGALAIGSASAASAPEKPELREGPSAFTALLSAGVEYDSNVSVIDVDNNSGADDFAAVFDAEFEFAPDLGDRSGLALGYKAFTRRSTRSTCSRTSRLSMFRTILVRSRSAAPIVSRIRASAAIPS